MRLIPLFYCAGIIKGLSNNNYAPKVDTLLSCSRCEWQQGVRVIENKTVRRSKGAQVCECVCRRVCAPLTENVKGERKLQYKPNHES